MKQNREGEEKKMEKKNSTSKKPMTYVMTYRGVTGYEKGVYHGKNRSVFVTDDRVSGLITDIRGNEYGGIGTMSEGMAENSYREAEETMKELEKKIDRIYVYLGKDGVGPGFEYAKKLSGNGAEVKLVACDCGEEEKRRFAKRHGMQIIWAECGGKETLREIVERELQRED
jgi:hypothetical protein